MKKSKLFLGILIVALTICVFVPKTDVYAAGLSLVELQGKFPHEKYWNHIGSKTNNPDGWTNKPCTHHKSCSYYGTCGCNSFSNAIQCMGFAYKLGYDAFGSSPREWTTYTGSKAKSYFNNSLKPGDVVRYNGHSIFITGVEGSTITYGHANVHKDCVINWNATKTKSYILGKGLTNVKVAPGKLNTSPKITFSYDANGGIGTVDSHSVLFENELTIAQNKFERVGYSFVGYSLFRKADASYYCLNDKKWQSEESIKDNNYEVRVYQPGETYTISKSWTSSPSTQNEFVFKALWKENTYVVNYKSLDDANKNVNLDVTLNGHLDIIDDHEFSKEGYGLQGWSVNRSSDQTYYVEDKGWLTQDEINKKGYAKKIFYSDESFKFDADLWLSNDIKNQTASFEFVGIWIDKQNYLPFKDVSKYKWYYSTIKKAYDNQLMKGTGEKTFSPEDNITRGMVVTVLHRMANQPKVTYSSLFEDVRESSYYSKAVIWAKEQDIVSGYKGTTMFGPDDFITRQDVAVILANYARMRGADVTSTYDLSSFADDELISNYAKDAMKWAVSAGILSGSVNKDTGEIYLNPKNNASRAECAKMLLAVKEKIK